MIKDNNPLAMVIKKLIWWLIVLFTMIFLLGIGCYYYTTEVRSKAAGTVIIPTGTSIAQISVLLEKQDIIQNKLAFTLLAKVASFYTKKPLMAGEYYFMAGASMSEVLKQIMEGEVVIHKIVVPEGYTSWQVAELLKGSYGVSSVTPFVLPDEGYLLPGTYFYKYGVKDTDLLAKMKQAMLALLAAQWHKRNAFALSVLNSQDQLLILASIVEKETMLADERPRIARVYMNRMQKKMLLQADPTVIYGITEGKILFERKVTFGDLKHISGYNTYINIGLPPTPICNPGQASILAVLNPAGSNDLYFVADGKGGHLFAETFEQHRANIQQVRGEALALALSLGG